jgi:putative membrane protein
VASRTIGRVWAVIRRWFDPDDVRSVGTTPDYRFSLSNERTFLAWLRTGLALVGGGLAVDQFLGGSRLRVVIAVALLGLGFAVAVRAIDRWARTERAMRLGEDLPASTFPAVLAMAIATGTVLLVAAIVLGALHK